MTRQGRLATSDLVSYLCKSVFICGSFSVLFLAASQTWAQGGGKAEPERIEFKRGASSATIRGSLRGDEQAEYVYSVREGQRVQILVSSVPRKSCLIELHGPNGDDLAFSAYSYDKIARATGDYFLIVLRPTESRGRSRYRLTVTVK
jgi:hypothetical protein